MPHLPPGERDQLDALLHPEFRGRSAEGMPFDIGGQHDGPTAMRATPAVLSPGIFEPRAEPDRFLDLTDGRLLVTDRFAARASTAARPWTQPLDT
jgi:2-(1,2-epoxy-1,2-dihydrophenyl)acetyl-CoA isomerase